MKSGLIYAIIPARGGSKGVPGKNIRMLKGYPLIAYSIAAAKLSKVIDRVIVSTDSPEIAETAKKFGAEVPFLRPSEFARDSSPDIDFFHHAISWFEHHETSQPELLVHLRPTTPLRDPVLIDQAIELLVSCSDATSLRSVQENAQPPQKMFGMKDQYLVGLFPDDPRPEYYNLPRQTFPKAYNPNGYVDIVKPGFMKHHTGLHGSRMMGFVTPWAVEIDGPDDFNYLDYFIEKKSHRLYDYLTQTYPSGI